MAETSLTTGLTNARNTIVREARFTQEANTPSWQLIEKVQLPRGAGTVRMPKVGSFEISDLTDGVDMTDEQSINMTNVDLAATERGAKIVITDKAARENGTTDLFRLVGKQFGDAGARKRDRDVQALYAGLNGGVAFGESSATLSLGNFAATIAKAMGGNAGATDSTGGEPFDPDYAVHHPHAVFNVTQSATAIGNNTQKVNDRREEAMLSRFFSINFNGVDLFQSKNIFVDSSGDAVGVLAERGAMVGLTSLEWTTERQRDASARGTEVNFVSDYGVFELDDTRGAPLLFAADAPSDTA